MRKKIDPDVKQIKAMVRAFLKLSPEGKRPALRWINDWFFSGEVRRCDHRFYIGGKNCIKCGWNSDVSARAE